MKIFSNISLRGYNTFRLDYKAKSLISIETEDEAINFIVNKKSIYDPIFILGGGSNLLFLNDFPGTLLHPVIGQITIEEQHPDYVIVSAGSGLNWDKFVEWCVENGFGGLENLSLIPGNVGASPVQNIGAYGVEVRDRIEKVRAISITDGEITEFSNNDCHFEYRNSIFKEDLKGRYLISSVFFKLSTKPVLKLDYGLLEEEVRKSGNPDIKSVRRAIINTRRSKLPDPEIVGNAGSFFKNPVVNNHIADKLKKSYHNIIVYEDQLGRKKIAAGWLIDQCGWKGKNRGDAAVHDKQALVLINKGEASGKEILDLSEEIRSSVIKKFGLDLEREVEVVGTI